MHRCGLRALRAVPAAVAVASALILFPAPSAVAAGGSATGPEDQRLTVSKSSGLDPNGETVTVSGTGYNTEKGVYVAFCVDNGAGRTPTPCIGGVDMSGDSGSSVWISSNPPSYGEGLAEPYKGAGHKGTFSVQVEVRAKDANTDCAEPGVTCSVITRNDHTRGGDQSQTVRIPVTFAGADSGSGDDSGADSTATPSAGTSATTGGTTGTTGTATGGTSGDTNTSDDPLASTGSAAVPLGITAVGLVAAGGAAWVWARRRRTTTAPGGAGPT
ncbi:LPXTG cell wall anchor domain-containing protein [Streptomyces europaeiscabiei]|uniref:LPXTG cell wall anchor domain-containing protein n=1 Tax=Streptomyces europaeiscabiei TaxID=146819 RepID=UPI0029A7BC25|nr:LPXTG cell wall anchor domain-containing protein [Streptomyces europaeiscabiei]MDX3582347.1 LPXTG cell wall anchor domain-containing protein [Streptomyces europaeiscabiei]MDX3612729.1 LPXTG cell wall anchor domain-containing protein [Streptomyces europaeiscabiei]